MINVKSVPSFNSFRILETVCQICNQTICTCTCNNDNMVGSETSAHSRNNEQIIGSPTSNENSLLFSSIQSQTNDISIQFESSRSDSKFANSTQTEIESLNLHENVNVHAYDNYFMMTNIKFEFYC